MLRASGAKRVLDLGCGSGKLIRALLDEPSFAADRGRGHLASPRSRSPVAGCGSTGCRRGSANASQLFQTALTYRDRRLAGFDAAAVVEVIEHLDPPRLRCLRARRCSSTRSPATVVVTTPNVEYNAKFESLPAGRFRHRDHRFEWTRAEFEDWAGRVAARYGYGVRFLPIGPEDTDLGAPTQMAVFAR